VLIGRAIKVSGRKREVVACSLHPQLVPSPISPRSRRFVRRVIARPSREPRLPTLRLKRTASKVDTLRVAGRNWLAERYGTRVEKLNVEVGTQRLENTRSGDATDQTAAWITRRADTRRRGIGIMNVLLAAVAERTREIGIRKAVGARRADIQMQFLVESVTVTLAGSAIGFVVE